MMALTPKRGLQRFKRKERNGMPAMQLNLNLLHLVHNERTGLVCVHPKQDSRITANRFSR